jgi:hypothetical protein
MQQVEGDHFVACHFPLVPVAVAAPVAAAAPVDAAAATPPTAG